jgi:hypothetical protein
MYYKLRRQVEHAEKGGSRRFFVRKFFGLVTFLLLAAFGGQSLMATSIDFSLTGSIASYGAFVDTNGYFGSAGATVDAGTPFSLEVAYDTALCTYSSDNSPEEYDNPCSAGGVTTSFTLGGFTYTGTTPAEGSWSEIYQNQTQTGSHWGYVAGSPAGSVQLFFNSLDAYQEGGILNGPVSNIDPNSIQQAYVCVTGNCESIYLSSLTESGGDAPEPGPFVLLGSGLAGLVLLRNRTTRKALT